MGGAYFGRHLCFEHLLLCCPTISLVLSPPPIVDSTMGVQSEPSNETINELSDESVRLILEYRGQMMRYGSEIGIVSMERVSKRFGSITNRIITFKTKLHPGIVKYTIESHFEGLLKTIKKMAALKDIHLLMIEFWSDDQIKKLAAVTQQLTRVQVDFEESSTGVLKYIKAVK